MNHRPLIRFVLLAGVILSADVSRADDPPKADKPAAAVADSMLGKDAGDVRDDNGLKMKLVWCPPGALTMEEVVHYPDGDRVTTVNAFLTHGYWLGKYEVTHSEWKQVMATEPWKGKRLAIEGDDIPVTYVNWDDAMQFCRKLTDVERNARQLPDGWEYTLPTEAQWERACRARTETKFSFGDDLTKLVEHAWFADNTAKAGEQYAHRVGQKKPNT